MKTFPKISVIIPSFNKVKYVKLTLDSIFAQNYPNLEVIIQDGGSTDGTVEVIKDFAKRHKIIWESKKDGGQLNAINIGLNKATGEILTYINADDLYCKDAFKKVSEAYIGNNQGLWFAGRGLIIDKDGKRNAGLVTAYKNLLLSLNSRFYLLSTNYLMQPSVFFTKKAYKTYGPFTGNHNFVMEYDFWLKLSNKQMPEVIDSDLSSFRIEDSTKTKTMYLALLSEDRKIVHKYTKNPLVILLHDLNNLGRMIVNKFV